MAGVGNVFRLGIFLLFFLALTHTCHIDLKDDGSYHLSVEGDTTWLRGAATSFMQDSKWRSTDDGSLSIVNATMSSGDDELGTYTSNILRLSTGDTVMEIEARSYGMLLPQVAMFVQRFPGGLKGSRFEANKTCTAFPAFNVSEAEEDVGYLSYGGMMLGDYAKSFGRWGPTADINDGMDGTGPLVLYNRNGSSSMVISPYSHVMAASAWHDKDAAILKYGVMGGVDELPAGFEMKTIAFCTKNGIGETISGWGKVMREMYNKSDDVTKYHQSQDISLSHLGYWTDNGAYYYYHPEPGKTYQDTLLHLREDFLKQEIPYQYMQLDSWFYPKDNTKAVTTWDANEDIFPKGIPAFQDLLNTPIVAHNRYWSVNTTYAKQNGGYFDFIIGSNLSLPMDPLFWEYIMGHGREEWGLVVYEQDWLNVQTLFTEILNTNLTAGQDWLRQMGRGARRHGLKIQYCMALPRHGLESLSIPEVTQARVSNDYLLQPDQWRIGVTSHLAAALGLAPSKDTFWTSSVQPGNTYNKTEPYPTLQTVVAVLSTGPVGPGDMMGNGTNVGTLLKCCNADGLILKPTVPATAIDDQLIESAFPSSTGVTGEVWTTWSALHDSLYGVVLAANLSQDTVISPHKAGFLSTMVIPFHDGVIYSLQADTIAVQPFTSDGVYDSWYTITVDGCKAIDGIGCLLYTAPLLNVSGESVALLGDMDKWVPMSQQRIVNVWGVASDMYDGVGGVSDGVAVTLRGQPGETIQFWYQVAGKVNNKVGVADEKGCVTLSVYPDTYKPKLPSDLDCRYSAPPITTPAPPTDPTFPPGGGAYTPSAASAVCTLLLGLSIHLMCLIRLRQ